MEKKSSLWESIFTAVIDGMKEVDRHYAKQIVPLGWIPDPYIRCKVMNKAYTLSENGEKAKAERLIRLYCLRRYTNELVDDIFEFWKENPSLASRIHILGSAIEAHKMGMYNLSIPTFCSQLEGYVFDVNKHEGGSDYTALSKYFSSDADTFNFYAKSLSKFLNKFLRQDFKWGTGQKPPLSRHAILHGYDTSYGTKANSIKMIMLFNLTQAMLGIRYKLDNGIED